MSGMLLVGVLLLIVAAYFIMTYNGLVSLRVRADNAWSDIDVQLKRRHDLIPNVVETVKGYASHEKGTLEAVVQARNAAVAAKGPAESAVAENQLTGALRSLFALAESYPQLRAVESFTSLQSTLQSLETSIQDSRRYYNAVVRDLNTKIEQFPSNFVADTFGFHPREFFEAEADERETPEVKF